MKTSIATVSISGTLPEKLGAIAAAGFDGVEIFEADFLTFDRTPEDVAAMARDHGLEITLFQPFRDFEGLPEPLRQAAFSRARRKFDLMERLGTDLPKGFPANDERPLPLRFRRTPDWIRTMPGYQESMSQWRE